MIAEVLRRVGERSHRNTIMFTRAPRGSDRGCRQRTARAAACPSAWPCSLCLPPSGGAAFVVCVGFLLDALVGHGVVGLPGHAFVMGHLPGRLHEVRAVETCCRAL